MNFLALGKGGKKTGDVVSGTQAREVKRVHLVAVYTHLHQVIRSEVTVVKTHL